MDFSALFQISHGVYLAGARDTTGRLIGSCLDTAMVVEIDPAQVIVTFNNQSYTGEQVSQNKRLTLSVLGQDTSDEIIRIFGTQSSRIADKWEAIPYHFLHDLPVFKNAVAQLELRVVETWKTKTHIVCLCDVLSAEPGESTQSPLLYRDYQNKKRKETKMSDTKKWVCTVCGYVYDGEVPFEELPEDWVCPLCGEPKSVFVQE